MLLRPLGGTGGNLIILGDSISAAYPYDISEAWPVWAVPHVRGRFSMTNRAVSGATMAGALAVRASPPGPLYIDDLIPGNAAFRFGDTAKTVLVLWLGNNDLYGLVTPPATLIAQRRTFMADSFALGVDRIVIVSMTRRAGGEAVFEAGRLAYNTDQVAHAAEDPARVFYADIADSGDFASPAPPMYQADGSHMSRAGNTALGLLIAVDINRAIGAT